MELRGGRDTDPAHRVMGEREHGIGEFSCGNTRLTIASEIWRRERWYRSGAPFARERGEKSDGGWGHIGGAFPVGSSAAGVRVPVRPTCVNKDSPTHASVLYVGGCKAGADMGQLSTWG